MTTKILPLFIPQVGCPHQCLFCNQHAITEAPLPTPNALVAEIETYLAHTAQTAPPEIAFFGGSFTLLPQETLVAYLDAVQPYLQTGRVASIRCSTRPDGIDETIIALLLRYHVTTVELGVQSMDDQVLRDTQRGHNADATRQAIVCLQQAGINVVGQMMLGLPGATAESEIETARELVLRGVVGARIYPLVVLPDTALAARQASGQFSPLSQAAMVTRGAAVLGIFADAHIPVLRIGLCANETLGALPNDCGFHPAIGEMIRSTLYRQRIETALDACASRPSAVTILVPRGALSQVIGQHGSTRDALTKRYGIKFTVQECDTLAPYQIRLSETAPLFLS